ncbi:MAG TPA: hypothetical protein PLE16_03675 [Spirochaetota bacterium]|jgi:hypothetical protein|nr:hypothetical protein [Spirochaetota bacterium]HOH36943.1 hypothetical protein [Spirochaetota bacterium]HPJ14530.1 hypothetical protein [Spirochaetota bacterium]HPM33682.1 hypothetical protein [Spirochaetota bacterium]HPY03060.1 hypothetical protein [Spirochaetota bacterium]
MIRVRTVLILLILSCIVSCSGADNGEVTVANDTDRIIRVYYETESEVSDEETDDDDNYSFPSDEDENEDEDNTKLVDVSNFSEISPGETKTLEVKSSITFDGYIKSSYCGILMRFDIDFNIFDQADITIKKHDFIDDVLSR